MKFIVYGRVATPCIFCERAKRDLNELEGLVEYTFIDVTVDSRLLEWFKGVDERHTTFPQVYRQVEGTTGIEYIGGYTELRNFLNEHRDAMAKASLSAIPEGFTL